MTLASSKYTTKEEVFEAGARILHKTLRNIIPATELAQIEENLEKYATNRKGYLGDLIEKYVFEIENNGRSEADFIIAGVELKTTPLKKHTKKVFVSKERLVFSMINYSDVVKEKWETSSFLQKNKLLLLMFYFFEREKSLLDYEFKFVRLLSMLEDISTQDIEQIKKDWEFIVAKINRGEAHLLSEGDTFYLGACTKAKNSTVVREQPHSKIPAKPRAFSLKQTYLNYIIQRNLLDKKTDKDSIYSHGENSSKTIQEIIEDKFKKYIGKNDSEILLELGWETKKKPKHFKRLIANRIITGSGSNKIEELEKANVTLRVITLEHTGSLTESLSFPAFDYKELLTQTWYNEKEETMSDFHAQLEMNKFLFVIFQKQKNSKDIVLKKIMFWNFPMKDIDKARHVWDKTIDLINEGKIVKNIIIQKNGKEKRLTYFPGNSFNGVAHVRPHGLTKNDVSSLPVADKFTGEKKYTKHCFWLNAGYIQQAIENNKEQV